MALRGAISWREWEKAVGNILRVNGWEFLTDHIIKPTDLRAMGVPEKNMGKAMRIANSKNRRKGLSDLGPVWKQFEYWVEVSEPLRKMLGEGPLHWARPPFTIMGYIECKVGSGTLTAEQRQLLEVANNCPGCFGYEARPEREKELIAMAGGKVPLA